MGNQILGYILSGIGLVCLLAFSFPTLKLVPFNIPLADMKYFMIGSLVVIIFGLVLLSQGGKPKQKTKEVPIYQGKQIIGYRVEK